MNDRAFKVLATTVRTRRKELRLKQSELAELAGCSTRFVHTIEGAKLSLRLDKLLGVLEVLGLCLELRVGRGGLTVCERDSG